MQSASMRGVGYRSCLTIGTGVEGLYIAVLFLFRVGHPPLFIPWNDIKIRRKKILGFPLLVLKFARAPAVALTIPQWLEDFLADSIAGRLPFEIPEEAAAKPSGRNWYWLMVIVTIVLIAALSLVFFALRRGK